MKMKDRYDIEREIRYKERRHKRAIRMAKQKAIGIALLVISALVILFMKECSICLFTVPSGIYFLFCRDDIAWKYASREDRRELNM